MISDNSTKVNGKDDLNQSRVFRRFINDSQSDGCAAETIADASPKEKHEWMCHNFRLRSTKGDSAQSESM